MADSSSKPSRKWRKRRLSEKSWGHTSSKKKHDAIETERRVTRRVSKEQEHNQAIEEVDGDAEEGQVEETQTQPPPQPAPAPPEYTAPITRRQAYILAQQDRERYLPNELVQLIYSFVPSDALWSSGCFRTFRQHRDVILSQIRFRPYWIHEWVSSWRDIRFKVHHWKDGRPPDPELGLPTMYGGVQVTYTPAKLCPYLCRPFRGDYANMTAGTRMAQGYTLVCRPFEYVVFNKRGQVPDLNTPDSWKDMDITWPPSFEVKVRLRFGIEGHDRTAGSMRIERTVKNYRGIKLGELILGLLQMRGRVTWFYRSEVRQRDDEVPARRLKELEADLDSKACLDWQSGDSNFKLMGMVIPTKAEWRDVNERDREAANALQAAQAEQG